MVQDGPYHCASMADKEPQIEKFPYQVFIRLTRDNRNWTCGGSLLTDQWVLSAAVCLTGDNIKIILGTAHINTLTPGAVVRTEGYIFKHPEHQNFREKFDVALIKLNETVPYTTKIKPIRLPSQSSDDNYVGRAFIASEYGFQLNGKPSNGFLHSTPLKVICNEKCQDYYKEAGLKGIIMCAKRQTGRESICNGDTGYEI